MTTFGVTPTGFKTKRLADILADLTTALSTVSDPSTGESLIVDLADENDPLVQVVNAFADGLAEAWEQLELAHDQFDPLKSIGAGLSGLVQLNGISRKPSTYTTATVSLTGTPNSAFVAGKKISNGVNNFTLPAVAFDGSGFASVVAVADEEGPIQALAGTLVKIVTPVPGWTAVTNPTDGVVGTYAETDTELRARQQNSTSATAQTIIESIYSALVNLDGVTYCRVYQNITLAVDSRGIAAKSVAVVIVGGDDNEIAESIFNRLPLADTYGSTTVNLTDAQGVTYPIRFSRPQQVDVYVSIAVTVVNTSVWPADGAAKIKAAIVTFAQQGARGLGIQSGYDQNGFVVGENVYSSDLYVAIGSVLGIKVTSVTVGVAPNPVGSEVIIEWDQVAAFDSANITVAVS